MAKPVAAADPRSRNPTSRPKSSAIFSVMKLSASAVILLVPLLLLFQLQSLAIHFSYSSISSPPSWAFFQKFKDLGVLNSTAAAPANCAGDLVRLREAVTFRPLKDLRFAAAAMRGNTWFMSELNDTAEGEEAEYLRFPSPEHGGRVLCIKGRDTHDGGNNLYALAWRDSLPEGAALVAGETYVSDTYYDYGNIWHGISAMLPFVGWYEKRGCVKPRRWVLYHWGELRLGMGPWLRTLMEATFGEAAMKVEAFHGGGPTCFEQAVVFRHNTGRMARERRVEVFGMLRCKARQHCNVRREETEGGGGGGSVIRLTLLLRTGARSFRNETAVVGIFHEACGSFNGCRLAVAHSDNLTFCEQVKLLSSTDVLASPHGAQLTNMIFMDGTSSVMEFFPKGWKELAGAGQYVYHWAAAWSGMQHRGAWRDPDGDDCRPPLHGRDCFSVYKSSKIGHNESYFREWTLGVLSEAKQMKTEQQATGGIREWGECSCSKDGY